MKFYKIKVEHNKCYTIKLCSLEKKYIFYRSNFSRLCIENYKIKQENEKLKNKLEEIKEIVDTRPYVAYTDYGDILYESDEILEIIRGGENEIY